MLRRTCRRVRRPMLAAFLIVATTPSIAQVGSAPTTVDAGADKAAAIEAMLASQVDLSWLFAPPKGPAGAAAARNPEVATTLKLAKVAVARKLNDRPDVARATDVLHTVVLAEAARRDLAAGITVSDADVAERVRARPGRYDEYSIRHIFVAEAAGAGGQGRSAAEAQRRVAGIAASLRRGEPFERLAATWSDDKATAAEGGLLSSMFGVYMADEFLPHVAMLPVGATTEPIHTARGYHILQLVRRSAAEPSFVRYLVTNEIIAERLPAVIEAAARNVGAVVP